MLNIFLLNQIRLLSIHRKKAVFISVTEFFVVANVLSEKYSTPHSLKAVHGICNVRKHLLLLLL